jgi:hypothetical protein
MPAQVEYLTPRTQNTPFPETGFTPSNIAAVVKQYLPINEIGAVMSAAAPQTPKESIQNLLRGEQGRLILLAELHKRFYDGEISDLRQRGIINSSYTLAEIGPSFGLHIAEMSENNRPRHLFGVEVKLPILKAAQFIMDKFQTDGVLPNGATIIQGDHTTSLGETTDVALASLVTQYDAGAEGTIDWLMLHSDIGVSSDLSHSFFPITKGEIESGIIRIHSLRSPGINSGLAWQLTDKGTETPFGMVYSASLRLDPAVYDDEHTAQIATPEEVHEGKITIVKHGDALYAFNWAFELAPNSIATDQEISQMVALQQTFEETYLLLGKATDGKRAWDGNQIAVMPTIAREKGLFSVVHMTTEAGNRKILGILPLPMILRNREEVACIAQRGLLSHVGQGKTFETVKDLMGATQYWVTNPGEFAQRFTLSNAALLLSVIMTKNPEIFEKLKIEY